MCNKRSVAVALLLLLSLLALAFALPALAAGAGGDHARFGRGGSAAREVAVPVRPNDPLLEPTVRVLQRQDAHEGENIFDAYGWVGAAVGDLDGDGASEYIVTAPWFQYPSFEGRAYVYSGKQGDLIAVHDGQPGNLLGYSAAAAGDVNADGVPDYAISGQGDFASATAGRAVVYSGADHSVLYEWTGDDGYGFGSSVSSAGDVNDDGHADIVVGAQFYGSAVAQGIADGPGRIYLFSGADGSLLWTRDGFNARDRLGTGVGYIADGNGDGLPDVIAAASGADSLNGRAYLFSGVDGSLIHTMEPFAPLSQSFTFGRFFARGAGDSDGDGVEDIFIGDYGALGYDGRAYVFSGADGSLLQLLETPGDGDSLGPGRGIPDVNGDGLKDFVVAGWQSSAAAPLGGKIYIFSGADGTILDVATGAVPGDALGVDALPLGDVDGDQRADYLVTAVGLDFSGQDVGRAYVITVKPGQPLPVSFDAK